MLSVLQYLISLFFSNKEAQWLYGKNLTCFHSICNCLHEKMAKQKFNCKIMSNFFKLYMICTSPCSILYWVTVPSSALEKSVPQPSEMWENCVYPGDQKGSLEIEQTGGGKVTAWQNAFYGLQHRKLKFVSKVQSKVLNWKHHL